MSDKVIVVGTNVRNVAESARKAGYNVFAITKYLDADLKLYANVEKISNNIKQRVEELAQSLNAKVVLCAGYEDLKIKAEVLGTDPKVAEEIVNKLKFYKVLDKAGIRYPELGIYNPSILKPIKGGGGIGIKLINSAIIPSGYLAQRYIEGVPCSVSLIVIDKRNNNVKPIAVNKIFVGWNEMNAKDFVYCGNLTPFIIDNDVKNEIIRTAIDVVELFDVVGCVGVDFILSDEPYVLELNPRFQGSLDSIEWSYDLNLFKLHVQAVEGRNIEIPKPKRVAARTVLFADRTIQVKTCLVGNPFFADIPNKNEIIRKGDPVISILASGKGEREVISKVIQRRNLLFKLIL